MGLEMRFQALPANCELLRKAQRTSEWVEALPFIAKYAEMGMARRLRRSQQSISREMIDFTELVWQTVQAHPGLDERYLAWGRQWDAVLYLLSARRRNEDYADRSGLIERAVLGGDVLNGNQRVRYLPPNETRRAQFFFANTTELHLAEHFDPDQMEVAGVYGAMLDFDAIYYAFEQLRDFYAQATAQNEGVVSFLF